MKKIKFVSLILLSCAASAFASEVKVQKGTIGWQLLVDGSPYMVRGMAYTPDRIGEDPALGTLRDWMLTDRNGNGRIDAPFEAFVDANKNAARDPNEVPVGDFTLMADMGVNTIRVYHHASNSSTVQDGYGSFSGTLLQYNHPPNLALLRELKTYGIRTAIGDYVGAYTIGSGADYSVGTDYTNTIQKNRMRASVRQMVLDFKDEDFLLMYILGNENNYSWTQTNAVSSPAAYAQFIEELAQMIHSLDPNHPVCVSIGDVWQLEILKQHAPSIDIYGTNAYRGGSFGNLFSSVSATYNKPVLMTEFGDLNPEVNNGQLNETRQTSIYEAAWSDIVRNAAGGPGADNAIGGVAFQWLDGWWKSGSGSVHNSNGSNNEEWHGFFGQADEDTSPTLRQPRQIYNRFKDLWLAPNQLPTVTITAPANNAIVKIPGAPAVEVDARDVDGRIIKVELLRNGVVFAEDSVAPYTFSWAGASAGVYRLVARATDNRGGVKDSAVVNVTVEEIPNQRPQVSIITPLNNASYKISSTIIIEANAQDSDDGVARVEFYRNDILIATDLLSPYTFTWTKAAVGNYRLLARAYDRQGAVTDSSLVVVNVDKTAPVVAIATPVANEVVFEDVTIRANATDNVGVVGVQFKVDSVNFGPEDVEAPFETVWDSRPAKDGVHSIQAIARDGAGYIKASTVIKVKVDKKGPTMTTQAFKVFTSSAIINWKTTELADARVRYTNGIRIRPEDWIETPVITQLLTSHSVILTNLDPSRFHAVEMISKDRFGNQSVLAKSFLTLPADKVKPTIAITAPLSKAIVSGLVPIQINAADNNRIESVTVVLLKSKSKVPTLTQEFFAPPFNLTWDSRSALDGTYTLTAIIIDGYKNTVKATVSVVLNNAAVPVALLPAMDEEEPEIEAASDQLDELFPSADVETPSVSLDPGPSRVVSRGALIPLKGTLQVYPEESRSTLQTLWTVFPESRKTSITNPVALETKAVFDATGGYTLCLDAQSLEGQLVSRACTLVTVQDSYSDSSSAGKLPSSQVVITNGRPAILYYWLDGAGVVSIIVRPLQSPGKIVKEIVGASEVLGVNRLELKGDGLSSGSYLIDITQNGHRVGKPFTVVIVN